MHLVFGIDEAFSDFVHHQGDQGERRGEARHHVGVQHHFEEGDVTADDGVARRNVANHHHGQAALKHHVDEPREEGKTPAHADDDDYVACRIINQIFGYGLAWIRQNINVSA